MFEIYSKLDSLMADGEPEEAEMLLFAIADELTDIASAKCDDGDFQDALELYREILSLMQRYYGNNVDFGKLELSIKEIQKMI
jgi:hypothetical protein